MRRCARGGIRRGRASPPRPAPASSRRLRCRRGGRCCRRRLCLDIVRQGAELAVTLRGGARGLRAAGAAGSSGGLAEAAVAAEGSLSGAGLNNFGTVRRCHVLNMSLLLSFYLLGLLVSSGQGRSVRLSGFTFPPPSTQPREAKSEALERWNQGTKVAVLLPATVRILALSFGCP